MTGVANGLRLMGRLPNGMNHGLIRLIPKSARKEDPKDWRPITLLNVSYKMVAKALANRIKILLPSLINDA